MGTHLLTHRLLSRESPSGALKAVLRKVPGKEKEKEKQFLEVRRGLGEKRGIHWCLGLKPCYVLGPPCHLCPQIWDQNRKVKSIDLTALDKHGSVYDDGEGLGDARECGVPGNRVTSVDLPLQTSLGALPGLTRRPTWSMWRRRSVPRLSPSSRAKPLSWAPLMRTRGAPRRRMHLSR